MDIKAYLQRINHHGSLIPAAQTLRQLQVAHLLAVPFENLSIHSGQPIILEDDALFTKIVERRRGGFCYELNGLFAALLRALGFQVTMLSAGVAKANGGFGPDFDHMALMVSLEQRWLVDVGFGDSFRVMPRRTQQEDVESEQVAVASLTQLTEHLRLFILGNLNYGFLWHRDNSLLNRFVGAYRCIRKKLSVPISCVSI